MNFKLIARSLVLAFALLPVVFASSEKVDVVIATADGSINTADLRGQVVYIDFWASWCAPCRKSFPWMNAMHAKYADEGLNIIAITVDKDIADSAAFLADLPPDFEIGYDPTATLAKLFELAAMPSAFIIDREGHLIDAHYGFRTAKTEDYEASIIKALQP
jgi:thiol-disulfide isomerase/thioredoxin